MFASLNGSVVASVIAEKSKESGRWGHRNGWRAFVGIYS